MTTPNLAQPPLDAGVLREQLHYSVVPTYRDDGSLSDLEAASLRVRQLINFRPSQYEASVPAVPARPLASFSDLVTRDLGMLNEDRRLGRLAPVEMFEIFEDAANELSDTLIMKLLRSGTGQACSLARLDLMFVERALSIAFATSSPGTAGDCAWITRRTSTRLGSLAASLAIATGQHSRLSWSDIAYRHPILDPRSFLPVGSSRDQEIYMYRVQHAMDHGYRAIVLALIRDDINAADEKKILEVAEGIMRLMGHLSRVRDSGEFYKLDPYLGPNGDVTGHGTGAYSAWVLLASFLVRGQSTMKTRLDRADNFFAFDPDARELVAEVATGDLRPLGHVLSEPSRDRLSHFLKGFHASHMNAVRQHASTSLNFRAPATPEMTNNESMAAAVKP